MFIGEGEGEGGESRDVVVVDLGVEDGDGFGTDEVVEDEVVVFVSDGEVVVQSFCKLATEYFLAHGLIVICISHELRIRWFRFFILFKIIKAKVSIPPSPIKSTHIIQNEKKPSHHNFYCPPSMSLDKIKYWKSRHTEPHDPDDRPQPRMTSHHPHQAGVRTVPKFHKVLSSSQVTPSSHHHDHHAREKKSVSNLKLYNRLNHKLDEIK